MLYDTSSLIFLSTLSLRRATNGHPDTRRHDAISIHALLAESDYINGRTDDRKRNISIHALLAESDIIGPVSFFNTQISIHALLAESDNLCICDNTYTLDFYPRSPCGERLYDTYAKVLRVNISIHALLAESDLILHMAHLTEHLFLSTLSLRRATLPAVPFLTLRMLFLSTLSLRRATISIALSIQPIRFLSTLSLRRATHAPNRRPYHCNNFYPRSPCGERRCIL